mmetsp:Transcript_15792/g.48268  ORF Transcript_15792/g.48268 Transcript_15792/m.48268 type:complete len:312 (-) Transcript_15792:278-1213(-)
MWESIWFTALLCRTVGWTSAVPMHPPTRRWSCQACSALAPCSSARYSSCSVMVLPRSARWAYFTASARTESESACQGRLEQRRREMAGTRMRRCMASESLAIRLPCTRVRSWFASSVLVSAILILVMSGGAPSFLWKRMPLHSAQPAWRWSLLTMRRRRCAFCCVSGTCTRTERRPEDQPQREMRTSMRTPNLGARLMSVASVCALGGSGGASQCLPSVDSTPLVGALPVMPRSANMKVTKSFISMPRRVALGTRMAKSNSLSEVPSLTWKTRGGLSAPVAHSGSVPFHGSPAGSPHSSPCEWRRGDSSGW